MTTLHKTIALIAMLNISAVSYAASEAEYGKVSKTWTLQEDGSREYRYEMELTLFTHTAMNSTYGESFILYNPEYQEVKIHKSFTRQVDGTVIETPDNALVEVLPRFAADAPAYNHLKELVVVHTGLELGATIFLDYSVVTKPGYYPALDIYEFLQETSPVKEYKATVIVPENTQLHRHVSGADVKVNETIRSGKKTFSYTLRNVPASSRESFQPQNRENVPCLAATTYASRTEALAVLNRELGKGQQLEAVGFAEYLTEKINDDKDKADAIRKHLVNNMAASAVPLAQAGYGMRDMETTLRSAYGTLAEKTGLLQVMLKAAGIPSEIIVTYPGNLKEEVQGLSAIKNMMVKARINREDVYLSAISLLPSTLSYRGESDRTYRLSGEEWVILPARMEITEEKELTAGREQAKDGYVICTLPPVSSGIDTWGMQTLNSKRESMFEIPAQLEETVTYIINVKDGLQLQTPAESKTIRNTMGSFEQTVAEKGDKVEVKRTITLNKIQYTPKEYRELRDLVNAWMNPGSRMLLFGE